MRQHRWIINRSPTLGANSYEIATVQSTQTEYILRSSDNMDIDYALTLCVYIHMTLDWNRHIWRFYVIVYSRLYSVRDELQFCRGSVTVLSYKPVWNYI